MLTFYYTFIFRGLVFPSKNNESQSQMSCEKDSSTSSTHDTSSCKSIPVRTKSKSKNEHQQEYISNPLNNSKVILVGFSNYKSLKIRSIEPEDDLKYTQYLAALNDFGPSAEQYTKKPKNFETVLTKYNGSYHRAVVLRTSANGKRNRIVFPDLSCFSEKHTSELYVLSNELKNYPKSVYKVELSNVTTDPEGSEQKGISNEYLQTLIEQKRPLKISFAAEKLENSHSVELFDIVAALSVNQKINSSILELKSKSPNEVHNSFDAVHQQINAEKQNPDRDGDDNPSVNEIEIAPEPASNTIVTITAIIDHRTLYIRSLESEANTEYLKYVNDLCEYGKTASPLTKPPQKGDVVLVCDGKKYHRAIVTSKVTDPNEISVALLEFGSRIKKKLSDLKIISHDLAANKRYTFKIILHDVNKQLCNEELTTYFESLMDEMVPLKIVYKEPELNLNTRVELIEVDSNESVNKNANQLNDVEAVGMDDPVVFFKVNQCLIIF